VLLDLQLASGTGIDVLRQVHGQVPDTVFIVLTNHSSPQYRRICLAAGATHFVDKSETPAVRQIIEALGSPEEVQ
jgi:DNA-binding NarL/FixJ family response regulator